MKGFESRETKGVEARESEIKCLVRAIERIGYLSLHYKIKKKKRMKKA